MKLVLWPLLFFMVACDQPRRHGLDGVQVDTFPLYVSRDEKRGVTCYRVEMHEGVSCLRDAPDGGVP